jgi:uncharacterized protein YgbK (DUF1537 family)
VCFGWFRRGGASAFERGNMNLQKRAPLIGAIADDMTGATDLALMLAKGGMRTVQVIESGSIHLAPADCDAIVIAMKSRTNPPDEAVQMSLAAAKALQKTGVRQILFKYCSTFDSTDEGNIGPVADALLQHLDCPIAVACPAFPATGRTIYQGHLFVNGRLLSESGMQDHPLTPMTDPDLARVLSRQSKHDVGLVGLETVRNGATAIAARLDQLAADGIRLAILDAVEDDDLRVAGKALAGARLITGGSGVALGLPDNFRAQGLLEDRSSSTLPEVTGRAAILSGSCSIATNTQVARAIASGIPNYKVDPLSVAEPEAEAARAVQWALAQPAATPVIIHATDTPDHVRIVQEQLGRDAAGALVEAVMAEVAAGLAANGFGRLVVAGGETSGSVIDALAVGALRIGPEIAPGVPWTETIGAGPPLALALKSGNFGGPDFFQDALSMLGR